MKVCIGKNVVKGPWGGGNQFVEMLSRYLTCNGHKVVYDLSQNDIDIILVIDPRDNPETSSIHSNEIKKYIRKNQKTLLIQRINECDERKGSDNINLVLKEFNHGCSYTIFISTFVKELFQKHGWNINKSKVILNGANSEIYSRINHNDWNGKDKLKIVTHHWGCNPRKGFDIYKYCDRLLSNKYWHKRISFTYIGNLACKYNFNNIQYIKPLSGFALATEIGKHHVYLTASQFEPAGMHHIEAAMCGLPIIFRNSGALPEYCKGFGVMFNNNKDFEIVLNEMLDSYYIYKKKINSYSNNATNMSKQYIELFKQLIENLT